MELTDLSYDPRDPTFPLGAIDGAAFSVQLFTTRNVYALDPEKLTVEQNGTSTRILSEGLRWAGQQQVSGGAVEILLDDSVPGCTSLTVEAVHAEAIKSLKVVLRDLPADVVGDGWWHTTSSVGQADRPAPLRPVQWNYPWLEWVTPWSAAGGRDGGAGLTFSVRDPELRAKRFYAGVPPWAGGAQVVEIVCEEDASRWGSNYLSPEIRVRSCADADAVKADAIEHLDWIEQAHGLVRWDDRADVPSWFRDVRVVANLHGRHWTGYVFNTYDSMGDALELICERIPGEQVLAYLPGWEGRYYQAYPWYRPDPLLGGTEGFQAFVDRAHALGAHVMPMFGMHGVNASAYPDWEVAVARHPTWPTPAYINHPDWDGDRAGEDFQVFCSPGEEEFRAHLLDEIDCVVADFGVDGVFLDTSGCWWNDPLHPLFDGYIDLVGVLRELHPDLLIAGEGWCDALLRLFPVNQSWFGVDPAYRVPEVLTRYARCVGHLSSGAAGTGSSGVHEAGFLLPAPTATTPGHLPVVSVVDDTLTTHRDAFLEQLDQIASIESG